MINENPKRINNTKISFDNLYTYPVLEIKHPPPLLPDDHTTLSPDEVTVVGSESVLLVRLLSGTSLVTLAELER